MGIIRKNMRVVSQREISAGIFSMWLDAPEVACQAGPGQFVSLYSRDASRLLPRPISICESDARTGQIRLVYRIAGDGTREFSALQAGDCIEVMGPLGNGYEMDVLKASRKAGHQNNESEAARDLTALLVAGGIGIPPMLELAKRLSCRKTIVLGYKDALFLDQDFSSLGEVVIAAEDGSCGVRGTVLDAIREKALQGDVIYSCGPAPMLKALKQYALEKGIPAWISLEERMACGIGACLACVCKTPEADEHTNVNNKRICKEGPVFEAREVLL